MILDIVFAILIVLAILKGYQRGLIVGLFSLVAVIIGLAAAMKLSTVVAARIGNTVKTSDEWLPIISFAVVFIVIVLLIRLGANALERTIEVVMLGWLNKLGGILLYAVIYSIVYSVILFYAEQIDLIKPEAIDKSVTYSLVQPLGPAIINSFANLIPIFKDMFAELQDFFSGVAKKLASL